MKDKEKIVYIGKDKRFIIYKGTRREVIDFFMKRCKLLLI